MTNTDCTLGAVLSVLCTLSLSLAKFTESFKWDLNICLHMEMFSKQSSQFSKFQIL